MDISVIIPAYNAEQWIGRAIGSVLDQTLAPAEILVVDDGSTDGTACAVRRYGAATRYLFQPNGGPAAARNQGIDRAESEWIAFLDADDEWLPHKMESQVRVLEENPDLKWCGSACEDVGNGIPSFHSVQGGLRQAPARPTGLRYFSAWLEGVVFITSGFVVHRSVFDEVGDFDLALRSGEDIDMWCRIALRYPRIGYCFDPCWYYHQDNPNSACRRGRTDRDLPLRSFCRNMRLAMELGPEVADGFRPYARKKVMDNLLRLAARDCSVNADTIEDVKYLFPLAAYERGLLRILRLLPKPVALRIVDRLRGRISL
jgi:glycosyltransferase involved in cell wall biosynthesis